MKLLKLPLVDILIVVACAITFWLANTLSAFSALLNRLFPCTQDPTQSFPCYGMVDVAMMILSIVVGAIFLGMALWNIYQHFGHQRVD